MKTSITIHTQNTTAYPYTGKLTLEFPNGTGLMLLNHLAHELLSSSTVVKVEIDYHADIERTASDIPEPEPDPEPGSVDFDVLLQT